MLVVEIALGIVLGVAILAFASEIISFAAGAVKFLAIVGVCIALLWMMDVTLEHYGVKVPEDLGGLAIATVGLLFLLTAPGVALADELDGLVWPRLGKVAFGVLYWWWSLLVIWFPAGYASERTVDVWYWVLWTLALGIQIGVTAGIYFHKKRRREKR